MQTNPKVQERPDVSAAERTSHELVMRILKLRWMGMENGTESDAGRAASPRSAMHVRSRSIGERITTCLRRPMGSNAASAQNERLQVQARR